MKTTTLICLCLLLLTGICTQDLVGQDKKLDVGNTNVIELMFMTAIKNTPDGEGDLHDLSKFGTPLPDQIVMGFDREHGMHGVLPIVNGRKITHLALFQIESKKEQNSSSEMSVRSPIVFDKTALRKNAVTSSLWRDGGAVERWKQHGYSLSVKPKQSGINTKLVQVSSSELQPAAIPFTPFVIQKGLSESTLTIGATYTKAQVIALFGGPDRYHEWVSELSNSRGIGFDCRYGENTFRFDPERGFDTFTLVNNDFRMQNSKVQVRIGDKYKDFMATHSGLFVETYPDILIESITILETGKRKITIRPGDSYLDLYFQEIDGEFELVQISYWEPM